ncbi:hypothetical protein K432DRAFT_311541, partial [Lepidopterella palustris CBS 459.81]
AIVPKNVYNIDKTSVILSMPGSVKVLISKNNLQGYKGARIKRTVVTAAKCVMSNSRYLNSIII